MRSIARVALLIAAIGTVTVAALFAAAWLDIWMAPSDQTPRINALSVGLLLAPFSALAWIVFLWLRRRPQGLLDVVVRILISCVLILGGGYCLSLGLIAAFMLS